MARQLYQKISKKPTKDATEVGSLADLDEARACGQARASCVRELVRATPQSAFLALMNSEMDEADFAAIFENHRVLGIDYRQEKAERQAAGEAAVAKPSEPQ